MDTTKNNFDNYMLKPNLEHPQTSGFEDPKIRGEGGLTSTPRFIPTKLPIDSNVKNMEVASVGNPPQIEASRTVRSLTTASEGSLGTQQLGAGKKNKKKRKGKGQQPTTTQRPSRNQDKVTPGMYKAIYYSGQCGVNPKRGGRGGHKQRPYSRRNEPSKSFFKPRQFPTSGMYGQSTSFYMPGPFHSSGPDIPSSSFFMQGPFQSSGSRGRRSSFGKRGPTRANVQDNSGPSFFMPGPPNHANVQDNSGPSFFMPGPPTHANVQDKSAPSFFMPGPPTHANVQDNSGPFFLPGPPTHANVQDNSGPYFMREPPSHANVKDNSGQSFFMRRPPTHASEPNKSVSSFFMRAPSHTSGPNGSSSSLFMRAPTRTSGPNGSSSSLFMPGPTPSSGSEVPSRAHFRLAPSHFRPAPPPPICKPFAQSRLKMDEGDLHSGYGEAPKRELVVMVERKEWGLPLTDPDLKMIQSFVTRRLISLKGSTEPLPCLGAVTLNYKGIIKIECFNELTVTWVKNQLQDLPRVSHNSLGYNIYCEGDQAPLKRYGVWVPHSATEDPVEFIWLLAVGNPDFPTGGLHVRAVAKSGQSNCFIMAVEEDANAALERVGHQLNFPGLGQVRFTVRKRIKGLPKPGTPRQSGPPQGGGPSWAH